MAPTRFVYGEGRSFTGRNGYVHRKGSRGRGSSINGRILKDNDGIILLPAGLVTTSKDSIYKGYRKDGEDLGLAHGVIVAKREG